MRKTTTLLAVALVALVAFTGFAAAAGAGLGPAEQTDVNTDGAAVSTTDDRALDGSNSPWMTGDDRLDRFQDRFALTDEQVETIRTTVLPMIEEGAAREEIRETVLNQLDAFGVTEPSLGPPADGGPGAGSFGQDRDGGAMGPTEHGGQGFAGTAGQGGPHGPGDGSCLG